MRSLSATAVLWGVAGWLAAAPAAAFCRTTTCDPNNPAENCQVDGDTCITTGVPLFWASNCVTVGVHRAGSVNQGLSYDDIAPVVEQAFRVWTDASCGTGTPSVEVNLLGPVACGVSEYNPSAGNANVVLFREDEWPYVAAANAIALTTTRFGKKTGELWDADIELNGVTQALSIGDPIAAADLQSVLTHEAGHFLGLSHSIVPTATMRPFYDPTRDGDELRTPDGDDIRGICAIYPPERQPATTSCDNRHGFSEDCGADQPPQDDDKGCSVGVVGAPAAHGLLWGALLSLGVVFARRGRRHERTARQLPRDGGA